jgi:hypothetical protein
MPAERFPRRQRGLVQRQIDDALAPWNAVPDAIRLRTKDVGRSQPTAD